MKYYSILICMILILEYCHAKQKNVIFVLVDDLGVSDVSFSARRLNGVAGYETPNIDKLANSGIQLTNYYTHSFCGPSRSAFLTSKYAHTLDNPFAMLRGGSLAPNQGSIAEEFKSHGYSTHIIGKWGIDYVKPSENVTTQNTYESYYHSHEDGMGPLERGFDTFYGLYSSGHNHYTKQIGPFPNNIDWHKHNRTHRLDYPDIDNEPTEYSTHLFTREAISVIKSWSPNSDPGFLFLSFTAPHDPLQAPAQYIDGPQCANIKNWRRKIFCGMVQVVDESIGEIVRQLESQNIRDDTIIVFTSDNGGAPSVGGYNYPYRGEKTGAFQGGIRVPALVNTGTDGAGAHYNHLMHIVDWGPTLLALAGATTNEGSSAKYVSYHSDIDGVSHAAHMQAAISGTSSPSATPRERIDAEFDMFFNRVAIVKPPFKLIVGQGHGREDRFQDPSNVSSHYDRDNRLRYVIEEYMCDVIDLGLGENWFPFSWALRFMIDSWFDYFAYGDKSTLFELLSKEFGYRIPSTPEKRPNIDWNSFSNHHIFLFNLELDPYEDNNVALENKVLVETLLQDFYNNMKPTQGHHASVQKQFAHFMMTVYKLLAGLLVALLVIMYIVFRIIRWMLRSTFSYNRLTSKTKTA